MSYFSNSTNPLGYSVCDKALIEKLVSVSPSQRQMDWQKLEFTAFFHYGINTFTNKEWGDGSEDISIFNPLSMDTDQWCKALKDAEIKACIITAKHHDGFCLWDTKYTDHSVMHTPYSKDIVKSLSQSCAKYDIKFGVYLSPWDRHEKTYGSGKAYDDYFCNQLTELLTNYGELYTVWFDGACGEGPNGKKQVYDWDRYYSVIRALQPNAVISISGPDVRWCGNEAGDCRSAEWSVVPARLFSQSDVAKASQQSDDASFRVKKLDERDKDLGSRDVVRNESSFIWYPAEVDTSIRPGWFHHDEEDDKVRPLEELKNIYINSVGGNSILLLNIPPHRDGYLTKYDTQRLHEIGEFIRGLYANPVSPVSVSANNHCDCHKAENILTDNEEYWKPSDYIEKAELVFTFAGDVEINCISLKEQILHSQRVESFTIYADGKEIYHGETIGYKKLVLTNGLKCNEIKVAFNKFRKCPIIKSILFYS